MQYAYATHPGLVREFNEDNFLVDEETSLWIIADGMGGHECGEVASQIVVDLIYDRVKNGSCLKDAIADAHNIVIMAAEQRLGLPGMGSTVVATRVFPDHYEIGWVGDSRAYLLDEGKLKQVTRDHSFVQQMLDAGTITEEEARQHPHRNVITQAIGASDLESLDVGLIKQKRFQGQQLLLCSDGLSDEIEKEEMASILTQDLSVEQKVNTLMQTALANGGHDNISIILIVSGDTAPTRPD